MAIDALEPHPLVRLLGKPMAGVTCDDLVRAVEQLDLQQVNLRYTGGDGRLKTMAFVVGSREHLIDVLTRGERVDGSSAFSGTDAADSDVYAVPRYRTAFINPFGERSSLDVICSLYAQDGTPLPFAREQIVRRAAEALTEHNGMTLEAFGELEYYLVQDRDRVFPVEEERGYQESAPFSKGSHVREQILGHLAAMGVPLKYAHGEVGNIVEADRQLVQHEIELLPTPLEQAADNLVLAKWVVREVAYRHGLEATFAPSVSAAGAGSGLHIHSRLVRAGTNEIVDESGLNDTGRRLIAGYLSAARSLTGFANTLPTSYLRFADGEESPEGICWGSTDRTGLVRVPLAWGGEVLPRMAAHANPDMAPIIAMPGTDPQTVEFRLGDGSADVHLLLAGMAVAARHGLANPDSLQLAARLSTDNETVFDQLPTSCAESADALEGERSTYEAEGVFPASVIDSKLASLRSHNDAQLLSELAEDEAARTQLIKRHWHVG